ncbi:MAG: hydrogenase iron-sulfur subunit [Candidatus Odinarchaeia archaeon]
MSDEEFEPNIIAFCCNECSYAAADLAGTSRLQYPPNIKIILIPCTGKIDITYILEAFKEGADGVIIAGCLKDQCHYVDGNYKAERRVHFTKKILDEIGFGGDRVEMYFMSAAMAKTFQEVVIEFTKRIKTLGPNPLKMKNNLSTLSLKKSKEG